MLEALDEHRRTSGTVLELFISDEASGRYPHIVETAHGLSIPTHLVSAHVAESLSETRSPQGVVAVCTMPDTALGDVLARAPRLTAVLVNAADPGNAGTVIRVADAAGAAAVVFAGTTVDPYNGKCVRASAGSLFHLPVVTAGDPSSTIVQLREAGLTVLAADARAETTLEAAQQSGLLAGPTAWVFGHEVRGLAGINEADLRPVRIAIRGRAESLNLATAAAVCLFASAAAHDGTPASRQPS